MVNLKSTICKLETIFPPSFFDCMEHLLIHLPYEARVCGPVFYRWIYPFERKLGILKGLARHKNRLEGSICEAYLMREVIHLCEFYFGRELDTAVTRLRRNENAWAPDFEGQLPVFFPKGHPIKTGQKRHYMESGEYDKALLCILMNCDEARELTDHFENVLRSRGYGPEDIELARINNLVPWLRDLSMNGRLEDSKINFIIKGGSHKVMKYHGYVVNGFKFNTEKYCKDNDMVTLNSGISLKTEDDDGNEKVYYGMLKEIIEMRFHSPGHDTQRVHLVNCDWYDSRGVETNKYGLIELQPSFRLVTKEPYMLANMASQVSYLEYPYARIGRHKKVWAVCPIRARHSIDLSSVEKQVEDDEQEFYQDEAPPPVHNFPVDFCSYNMRILLADTSAGQIFST